MVDLLNFSSIRNGWYTGKWAYVTGVYGMRRSRNCRFLMSVWSLSRLGDLCRRHHHMHFLNMPYIILLRHHWCVLWGPIERSELINGLDCQRNGDTLLPQCPYCHAMKDGVVMYDEHMTVYGQVAALHKTRHTLSHHSARRWTRNFTFRRQPT